MNYTYKDLIKSIEKKMPTASDEEQVCLDYALEVLYSKDLENTFEIHQHSPANMIIDDRVTLELILHYDPSGEPSPYPFLIITKAYFGTPTKKIDSYIKHPGIHSPYSIT